MHILGHLEKAHLGNANISSPGSLQIIWLLLRQVLDFQCLQLGGMSSDASMCFIISTGITAKRGTELMVQIMLLSVLCCVCLYSSRCSQAPFWMAINLGVYPKDRLDSKYLQLYQSRLHHQTFQCLRHWQFEKWRCLERTYDTTRTVTCWSMQHVTLTYIPNLICFSI